MSLDASHSSTPNTSRQIVDASLASHTEFRLSASARAQAGAEDAVPDQSYCSGLRHLLAALRGRRGLGRDMLQHPLGQSRTAL